MNKKTVRVGNILVGEDQDCMIVEEVGINGNGDMSLTKKLVDVAVQAGAHAVKFQTRNIMVVYTKEELAKPRFVPRYMLENALCRNVLSEEAKARLMSSNFENSTTGDLKHALEYTNDEYREIDRYCKNHNIMWFTSCWDTESFSRMEQFNLPAHKIASACNEDDELLRLAKESGKPIILSTGMSDLVNIKKAVEIVGTEKLILLHCTSVYPQGNGISDEILKMVNLRGIKTLRETFRGVPVGFSSHDSGIQPTYAAVAQGAVMIEKHVTLERGMFGSDQSSSTEGHEFCRLCQMVRDLPLALGDGEIRIYPDEEVVAKKLRRVRRCPK